MYSRFLFMFFLLVLPPIGVDAKSMKDDFVIDSSRSLQSLSSYTNDLLPFSDIVVIQRRYLVKTGRFEISPSALLLFSNEFFINAGIGGNLAFYPLEKHGLEFRGFYTTEFRRSVLIDMWKKLRIVSSVLGDRTIYSVGMVYKWIPIYGKISWFDNKIIPFEMSFFLGGGITRVRCGDVDISANSPEAELVGAGGNVGECETVDIRPLRNNGKRLIRQKTEPTLIFGFGQSYALSRNMAFRIDLNWQYYGQLIGGKSAGGGSFHHWDVLMTSGLSFYLPRRKVR